MDGSGASSMVVTGRVKGESYADGASVESAGLNGIDISDSCSSYQCTMNLGQAYTM
jgi:hypothetical protein